MQRVTVQGFSVILYCLTSKHKFVGCLHTKFLTGMLPHLLNDWSSMQVLKQEQLMPDWAMQFVPMCIPQLIASCCVPAGPNTPYMVEMGPRQKHKQVFGARTRHGGKHGGPCSLYSRETRGSLVPNPKPSYVLFRYSVYTSSVPSQLS